MTTVANAMVNKSRGVSLLEMGYENCGLDDYYQACGTGAGGSFHNASGYPLIDKTKFPDMKAMTDHAHSIGLKMGWYGNNCGCNEHQNVPSWGPPASPGKTDGIHHYEGEIQATIDFGFDGIKLDGCGEFMNLTVFAELMNKTGKPLLVEDCHWGKDGPGDWGDGGHLNQGPNKVSAEKWCPYNFFRTSGDIGSNWGSVIRNLLTVDKHQPWSGGEVRTGPGCFAYPDMLEVGQLASFEEDRSHFAAWCINSAPLILGHDLANDKINDLVWPIITNKHAVSVSQSFAEGATMHPGGLVRAWTPSPTPTPGPAPSPPTPAPMVAYLWGEAAKTSGWSVPAKGSGTKGPITIKTAAMSTALCIEACDTHAQFLLKTCDGSAGQDFIYESNGNLHADDGIKLCIAVENFEGPGVVGFKCNTGENEEFTFDAATTSLCSMGATSGSKQTRCLNAKSTSPHPGPGPAPSPRGDMLLYAKPQPGGAVAVLVINNRDPSAAAATATITMEEIRFASGATKASTVLDIWTSNVTTLAAGTASLTTDAISGHDSRFFLISPASSNED